MTPVSLTQHPLSGAFPAMPDEDFVALRDDIENNGLREPIVVYDEQVLDGWHRYQACLELGIMPRFREFPEDEDPVVYVKSLNLNRRHLTGSQRAAAVVKCSAWVSNGSNQHTKRGYEPSSPPPKTNVEMAKEAGVTPRTIQQAKEAEKAGLGDKVRDGKITVKEAAQMGKPIAPPKPVEPPPPEPPNELEERNAVLVEENDRLMDRLAVAAMEATPEEKASAKALIDDLHAQVKSLTAQLDAVKSSRDGFMRENKELKSQVSRLQKKLDKLVK